MERKRFLRGLAACLIAAPILPLEGQRSAPTALRKTYPPRLVGGLHTDGQWGRSVLGGLDGFQRTKNRALSADLDRMGVF